MDISDILFDDDRTDGRKNTGINHILGAVNKHITNGRIPFITDDKSTKDSEHHPHKFQRGKPFFQNKKTQGDDKNRGYISNKGSDGRISNGVNRFEEKIGSYYFDDTQNEQYPYIFPCKISDGPESLLRTSIKEDPHQSQRKPVHTKLRKTDFHQCRFAENINIRNRYYGYKRQ